MLGPKVQPTVSGSQAGVRTRATFIRPGCASQISSSCGYHSTAMLISNTWTTTAWVRKFITRHHITSKTVSNIWDTKKVRFWSGAGSSAKQQCYDVFQSLQKSRARTGWPVIVNTSFNVRGEPIVCTPEDSYRCFMRTEMDFLVLETCVLAKKDQPPFLDSVKWRSEIRPD